MTLPYRIDGPKNIEPEKLLLWPDNPRLKTHDFSERKYSLKQLVNPENQKNIFKELSRYEEHRVQDLTQRIRRNGFMPEKAITVMEVKGSNRYLVLEGNRRLTAVRTILSDKSSTISAATKESIKSIPCWLFVHVDKKVPIRAAFSRFVAEAHIVGQKPHTRLQRAHMVYDSYEGILEELSSARRFRLDETALSATAKFFDLPQNDIREQIAIVRLYKQVVGGWEFEDIPKECSERLSWVQKHSRLFQTHFGYDPERLCLDNEGLDRFFDIFLHEEAAVHNPQQFRTFLNVMRKGTAQDIEDVREGPDMLAAIARRIKDQTADSRFIDSLKVIESKINALRISDYRGTHDEINVIKRISRLVDNKLRQFAPEHEDTSSAPKLDVGFQEIPANIQEAMLLAEGYLAEQIVELIQSKPNSSCIKKNVPSDLLKMWALRSSGEPRARFIQRARGVLQHMIRDGIVQEYQAKNTRVRV